MISKFNKYQHLLWQFRRATVDPAGAVYLCNPTVSHWDSRLVPWGFPPIVGGFWQRPTLGGFSRGLLNSALSATKTRTSSAARFPPSLFISGIGYHKQQNFHKGNIFIRV